MTSETKSFTITKMDGQPIDFEVMREWLEGSTHGGRIINLTSTFNDCRKMQIDVDDDASAFWVMMRWGEDILRYRKLEEMYTSLRELAEIQLKQPWFPPASPMRNVLPLNDYTTIDLPYFHDIPTSNEPAPTTIKFEKVRMISNEPASISTIRKPSSET